MNKLPRVLGQLVCDFAFGGTLCELESDLDFYIRWQTQVPGVFLSQSLMDLETGLLHASPMIKNHPYAPTRKFLIRPESVWSITLLLLVASIDKHKVRRLKTYKGCIIRWARECLAGCKPEYYQKVHTIFTQLTLEHFYPVRRAFVAECLKQIHALSYA